MSFECPSRPPTQNMKDRQQRPRKPPPRPPPPNISPQQRKVSSGSVVPTPALRDRPIPQPRRRSSQDAAVSSALPREHLVAPRPAAPTRTPPPPPRGGKLSPNRTSPTKQLSPVTRPRSSSSNPPPAPPQGPSPRPRKRIIDTNSQVPQHFHTLPTRSHHKSPHKTLPVSSKSEDFSDHVYEKVKYSSPPIPPRPTQAALHNRKTSPTTSKSSPALHSMVNKVTVLTIAEEEEQGIYTALLQEDDTSDQDYTPLNNYVTMQPSLMRCGTPPNNDADQQGMYMSIDREALEDSVYQAPNDDGSTTSTYDVPRPVSIGRSSHCVHPVPAPRTTLQHFTPQHNH